MGAGGAVVTARLELAQLLYRASTADALDEATIVELCNRYETMPASDIKWAERYTRSCLVAQGLVS